MKILRLFKRKPKYQNKVKPCEQWQAGFHLVFTSQSVALHQMLPYSTINFLVVLPIVIV